MTVSRVLAERRPALQARAGIIQLIRQFFAKEGFLEMETPLRIPAPAPETYIDAVPASGWFLHTSPELCMKRALAAGFDRIFQICHCWREGERGRFHLPEFTMLEWYRTGVTYLGLMDDCESMVSHIASGMNWGECIRFRGKCIALTGVWDRITVRDAYVLWGGMSMEKALETDRFDEVMVQEIEPRLGLDRPAFLYDYPAQRSALARLKKTDPSVCERFELYMGGVEIANGFSELTDVAEQRTRFQHEAAARKSAGKACYPSPDKFLRDLAAMPSAAGIALGIDRLVMVLLDKESIDDVVTFTPEEL